MIVLSDTGFHAAEGDPANLKLCQHGAWEDRMLVETVLSMLTLVCHLKKVMHRGWTYFHARLAFNILVQWYGLQPAASCPENEIVFSFFRYLNFSPFLFSIYSQYDNTSCDTARQLSTYPNIVLSCIKLIVLSS